MRRCELRSMITRIFEGPPLGFNKGRLLKHLEWTDRDKSSRPDPTTEAAAVWRVAEYRHSITGRGRPPFLAANTGTCVAP